MSAGTFRDILSLCIQLLSSNVTCSVFFNCYCILVWDLCLFAILCHLKFHIFRPARSIFPFASWRFKCFRSNYSYSDCHCICILDFATRMILLIIHVTLNKTTILNYCINDNEDDDDDDSLVVWCSSSCLGHSTILGRI